MTNKQIVSLLVSGLHELRCGCDITGKYARPACHTKRAVVIDGVTGVPVTSIDTQNVSGGWHDAGDYGRYTVPAATALGHILYACELFGREEKLLDECEYELEWLLKMQRDDGAFYHKVATRYFPGMIMPQDDDAELLLFPCSSTATGAACAALALASRIYNSERYKAAALRAWEWLVKNPRVAPYKDPQNVISGEYGDYSDRDERFWAACELSRLGYVEECRQAILLYSRDVALTAFGWGNVGGFGALSLLHNSLSVPESLMTLIHNSFISRADILVEMSNKDKYNCTLFPEDYKWGSNMTVCNNGIILGTAYKITNNPIYKTYAEQQVAYLLGNNPMKTSYITGVPGIHDKCAEHPHHRPSVADGIRECVPGFLVGGPNTWRQDEPARQRFTDDTPPQECYIDDDRSFSINEVAIYWNSAAICLFGFLASFE